MLASRWFWAVTLGSLLALSAVAVPAAAFFTGGHSPFSPAQGGADHPTGPGWNNDSGNGTHYSVTFSETGLPAGVNWSVSVWRSWGDGDGYAPALASPGWGWGLSNSSANATIGFSLLNGSYVFSIANVSAGSGVFVPTPASGQFSVNGSAVSVPVSFARAALYLLSFVETGLPSGTFWSVFLSGSFGYGGGPEPTPELVQPACGQTLQNGSNQSTVSFFLQNGSYDFFIPNASSAGALYVSTPSIGNVTVNGSGASVSVAFRTVPLYALTFAETGLPNGTWWSVGIWSENENSAWNGTNTSSLTFWVANGTYNFSVSNASAAGAFYVASPSHGSVSVNGSAVTVSVTYAAIPLYALAFTESGLPNGTWWSVLITTANGSWFWNGTNTTVVTFWVTSGSYNFSIGDRWTGLSLYVPSPSNGTVVVNGSAVDVAVVFSAPALYTVTFVESGLPTGTNWSVALFERPGPCAAYACASPLAAPDWGVFSFNESNTTTLSFTVPDGTYGFFVPVVCNNTTVFLPSPADGNVTVNGSAVTVSISFAPLVLTNITFVESGLPNGTAWFVAVESSYGSWAFGESNGTNLSFVLPSGIYGFDIGPVWVDGILYTPSPATVSETATGAAITLDVTFAASG
jgi:hypothetical protein